MTLHLVACTWKNTLTMHGHMNVKFISVLIFELRSAQPRLPHRTVCQPFLHGRNPKIMFHIPWNPHLWKRLQARKKLIEKCAVQLLLKSTNSCYISKSANIIRTKLNNFHSLSRGIWHCSRCFIISELWCHQPTVSGGTPVWETMPYSALHSHQIRVLERNGMPYQVHRLRLATTWWTLKQ
jgi:hypothetical protein